MCTHQRVKNIHPWYRFPRAGGWESSISCRKRNLLHILKVACLPQLSPPTFTPPRFVCSQIPPPILCFPVYAEILAFPVRTSLRKCAFPLRPRRNQTPVQFPTIYSPFNQNRERGPRGNDPPQLPGCHQSTKVRENTRNDRHKNLHTVGVKNLASASFPCQEIRLYINRRPMASK